MFVLQLAQSIQESESFITNIKSELIGNQIMTPMTKTSHNGIELISETFHLDINKFSLKKVMRCPS